MTIQDKYPDELKDINPRFWLRRFRQTSITYLIKMLLFYHGIGLLLMLPGMYLVDQLIQNYESPTIPRSLVSVLAAGPIEETIFFGIPFYVIGNPYFVLITGSVWAMSHILNTPALTISSLAFGNWFFVIPLLFFSLRTWISGKGWFAIVSHSAWNGIIFGAGCTYGEFPCTLFGSDGDAISLLANYIVLPGSLVALTYLLYKNKKRQTQGFGDGHEDIKL
ncbi:MAG TPA: CPBP family intramembrane glutamic endopeptidase [Nitrososphaera sp.]|nr:CPBP family intramembrane glutamic endopeptidase [Nitrososphaera sp.]